MTGILIYFFNNYYDIENIITYFKNEFLRVKSNCSDWTASEISNFNRIIYIRIFYLSDIQILKTMIGTEKYFEDFKILKYFYKNSIMIFLLWALNIKLNIFAALFVNKAYLFETSY